MSETNEGFKPIETQEELNAIIKDRLKRERESAEKRFEGWVSPEDHAKAIEDANKAFDDYKKVHEGDEQTIKDLTAKNKEYEKDCHVMCLYMCLPAAAGPTATSGKRQAGACRRIASHPEKPAE